MNASTLIRDLTARGVRLEPRGDRLHVDAPAGTLTAAIVEELRRRKGEVLAALAPTRAEEQPTRLCSGGCGRLTRSTIGMCAACERREVGYHHLGRRLDEPAPGPTPLAAAFAEAGSLRAAWAGAAREVGELCGWPRLPLRPGLSVATGAACWHAFISTASAVDLAAAVEGLRGLVATLPRPEVAE